MFHGNESTPPTPQLDWNNQEPSNQRQNPTIMSSLELSHVHNPALPLGPSVDNGPTNSDSEYSESWDSLRTQTNGYDHLSESHIPVRNTIDNVPEHENGFGAPLDSAHDTISIGSVHHSFSVNDTSSPHHQQDPTIDVAFELALTPRLEGSSLNRQEGYRALSSYEQPMHYGRDKDSHAFRLDPWSPENASAVTQTSSHGGFQQSGPGRLLQSIGSPSQPTNISSEEIGTGDMSDSILTVTQNHAGQRCVSGVVDHIRHPAHGPNSSDDPQSDHNRMGSPMLTRFLEAAAFQAPIQQVESSSVFSNQSRWVQ
jgi:hypothetical protein